MTSSSSSSLSSDTRHSTHSNSRWHAPPSNTSGKDGPAWPGGSGTPRGIEADSRHGSIDENSPLLSPAGAEQDTLIGGRTERDEHDDEQDEFQKTKGFWYLILLTISIGGLQVAWAVELSNGTPYLLSLGLTKSLMALVWIAGPITGTLVQPYVGMLSDNCRVPWGKRKPFILGGAAATASALMFLAWIREIVSGFLGLFGADPESKGVKTTIIVVAVIWIYVLDVAVNTVQASIRAFIVDCAPSHQQEAANSMASRFVGVGNIVGYIAGGTNLPKYFWWFGRSQFKDLCAIASIALCSTVLLSVSVIHERNPQLEGRPAEKKAGVGTFFVKIFASIKKLPPQVAKVCTVQFFAWVGFFPMLFYTSSYIGEIYVEPFLEKNPNMTKEELDDLYENATRVGTHALLIFAITSLVTNVLLPFFIDPTYDNNPVSNAPGETPGVLNDDDSGVKTWLNRLVIPGLTLRRAWLLSHFLFAGCMFCTVLVRTVEAATVLIGLIGVSWALALWAPWAIISAEISRRDALHRTRQQQLRPVSREGESDASPSAESFLDQERRLQDPEDEPDQAGVILGIHNMAIASPQMIATLGSSVIFGFFQKERGVPGDHSIAIVLACGGFFVLIAAYFVYKIQDGMSTPADAAFAAEEGEATAIGPASPVNKRSMDTPRQSMERATLARSSSYGAGLEY
ncbi:Uu.00g081020.m01.CDS01 [Anthostomella pinea]|uniref:Uu.00g081020.m01.CDS01 n=1 Tax=Anthostomella pinea TaxID=933095 RepID=A0AAI8YJ94_9PEZI|nr:Uu.00g081020.m01.CDS01 [Anthostomella pinea]